VTIVPRITQDNPAKELET